MTIKVGLCCYLAVSALCWMSMTKRTTVSERLRAAIVAAPQNQRRISLETGVATSVLSRFVRGEQGITLETADVLAAYLGLDLLPVERQKDGR